ncbi:MAG: cation-translocating P-type ATPase [Oscillospiraceae bacterium]|nr:cation-translocating P-type ATPase [Oscillospiraceae bacterium]
MNGLTEKQVASRLSEYGTNTIAEKNKNSAVKIFAGQFRDVMVMILLGATVISVFLGEIYDAVTIIAIVFLNAVLGFIQEYKTEKTLEALASMTAPTAKVVRDAKIKTIPAKNVVPDDIIIFEAGDRIPADAVIVECSGLFTDESMLNGESEPVSKRIGSENDKDNSLNRPCVVYSGTVVTRGNGKAVVIATGKNAQVGKISHMISETAVSQTPLQKRLGELGKIVALICIGVCIVVFLAGVLRGEPIFDMLMTGITIAIAAIPEGLPATVTIALALAVNRMLKVKALVNKLHSVETLGCASVICSDKTGTITENKMTVKHIYTDFKEFDVSGTGYKISGEITLDKKSLNPKAFPTLEKLFECSVLCSTAKIETKEVFNIRQRGMLKSKSEWNVHGDPTEIALLIAASKGGLTREKIVGMRKIAETPFDSETKMMSVTYKNKNSENITYVKGAPDVLIKKCGYTETAQGVKLLDNTSLEKIEKEISFLSKRGLRVLALAYSQGLEKLVFIGLAAMSDPPREEAKTAIRKCANAHIKTVMITGDHKETAAAVAKEAGILRDKKAVTGEELDNMTDEQLDRNIDDYAVYARVSPSHKLRLVKAYKRKGNVVTMTGDGVNDAPAIKEADVGVAMGITGTDVAKQAADVVLLDDNFATLVSAVEQGRGIYANIRKFVRYLLSCNIGEVIVMFLGILMGFPMVLLPTQLLLVNLVTDGLPAIALGMEPCEKDVMKNYPRGINESFFSNGLLFKIIIRGVLIGLSTLGCFTVALDMSHSVDVARTAALVTLIFSQLIHVFECKSETKSLFGINPFSNMKLVLAVLVSLAVVFVAVYFPPAQLVFGTVRLTGKIILTAFAFSVAIPVVSSFGFVKKKKNNDLK